MRTTLAALLTLALATPALAGDAPRSAPKADLDRPAATAKPVDGKALCTYVSPDQNAPSDRTGCVATNEPMPEHPVEKTPPGGPGTDSQPSAR
jgi:hypothetical protein